MCSCPITLAGIDSIAEGHNWDNVNNIILTSYTWAADKIVQAINRAHRLTSKRDVNLYAIICDQSADRVIPSRIEKIYGCLKIQCLFFQTTMFLALFLPEFSYVMVA